MHSGEYGSPPGGRGSYPRRACSGLSTSCIFIRGAVKALSRCHSGSFQSRKLRCSSHNGDCPTTGVKTSVFDTSQKGLGQKAPPVEFSPEQPSPLYAPIAI